MRILSVVTLVSPFGEYGGPLRVALNQLTALRARGHEVVLAGAHRGFPDGPPSHLDGVPTRLFAARTLIPGTGFAGLAAPGLARSIRRHAPEFDAVHIHAARDLVTLPAARAALRAGARIVVQPHGMIDETDHPLARPLDTWLTRPILAGARAVTYLTPEERDSLRAVTRDAVHLEALPNGVPLPSEPAPRESGRRVLYLARLAPRKRPVMFVEAAEALCDEFPDAHFTLVGPDEGEGDAVAAAIAVSRHSDRIEWTGPAPMDRTLDVMRDASVYVLPSVDEPYPMSVLEAMSLALPVVITDSCGLAPFVRSADAGTVVGPTAHELTAAIRAMLTAPDRAAEQGRNGRTAVAEDRSMDAIAAQLESLYR